MNRGTFAAAAISLLALYAAPTLAEDGDRSSRAGSTAADKASEVRRGESPAVRAVVAPPRPTVETIVQPGLHKIEKHERLTDVLKARKRAGRSDRVAND